MSAEHHDTVVSIGCPADTVELRCTEKRCHAAHRHGQANRNKRYAAFTPAQLVAGNKHHVARSKLLVTCNKLRVAGVNAALQMCSVEFMVTTPSRPMWKAGEFGC